MILSSRCAIFILRTILLFYNNKCQEGNLLSLGAELNLLVGGVSPVGIVQEKSPVVRVNPVGRVQGKSPVGRVNL
jgi:hypothetical protein